MGNDETADHEPLFAKEHAMRYRPLLCLVLMSAVGLGWGASAQAGFKPVDGQKDKPAERQKRPPRKAAPKVGDVAPVFKLKMLDSEKVVDLKGLAAKRPVLLFFGSYT